MESKAQPPPYWAFAWAGGQALARYVLDHRDTVAARSVLDFGTGSGLVAIAAAKSGARLVVAADIDGFATAAIGLNCWANGISCMLRQPQGSGSCAGRRGEKIEIVTEDIIGRPCSWDVILVGDMCYERPLPNVCSIGLTLVRVAAQTCFSATPAVPISRLPTPESSPPMPCARRASLRIARFAKRAFTVFSAVRAGFVQAQSASPFDKGEVLFFVLILSLSKDGAARPMQF